MPSDAQYRSCADIPRQALTGSRPGADMLDPLASVLDTGNRKIDARIFQHSFGIIGLEHRRFCGEQRRIEADRCIKVGNADMEMHTFHEDIVS